MNSEKDLPSQERKANPITAAFNKRQATEAFIEQGRKKFRIYAGEPILIPLQGVLNGQLVPVKPFEELVAIRDFDRDLATFMFQFFYPAHIPRPAYSREDLMFKNLGRVQYGEWLKAQGYARPAHDDEVDQNGVAEVLKRIAEAENKSTQAKAGDTLS